jgi:hypothetical protein
MCASHSGEQGDFYEVPTYAQPRLDRAWPGLNWPGGLNLVVVLQGNGGMLLP